MDKLIDRLKRQFEENPALVIGASAALVGSFAKLWQARNDSLNRRTWAREVSRRERKNYR